MKNSMIVSPPARPLVSKLLPLCAAVVLISACASSPSAPEGAAEARAKLSALRSNSELATRAPLEIQTAELAVSAAERPRDERDLERHYVLIADQQVDIARSWAQTRSYEAQRAELSARREAVRLEARTREADMARRDATSARSDATAATAQADAARMEADAARARANAAAAQAAVARRDTDAAQNQTEAARRAANEAQNQTEAARRAAESAQSQSEAARRAANEAQNQAALARTDASAARAETEELQRQIADLNAEITDRGMVVTLGDVMFETGMSDLRGGTPDNLDKLVAFLKQFESRTVIIEGHTDSVGSESSNQALSQRRADSVATYLTNNGIARSRISSLGLGQNSPIADNDSPTGRQQNRRVEVIISNPPQ